MYDLLLAILVSVPVAKCMCVDATATGDFRQNALDKCYFLVPTHMKPMILGMLQASYFNPTQVDGMCSSLVQHASDQVQQSMEPWFSKQFEAAESIASAFDFLVAFFDADAGRCMDFEDNPYATVLIPEPFDYFAGCAATTQCRLQCAVESDAFETALESFAQSPLPKVFPRKP
jgi:hypothetical protein